MPGINILNDLSVDLMRGQVRCGTERDREIDTAEGAVRLPAGTRGRNLAYLPQRPSLFPFLSVEVNLRLSTGRFRRKMTWRRWSAAGFTCATGAN